MVLRAAEETRAGTVGWGRYTTVKGIEGDKGMHHGAISAGERQRLASSEWGDNGGNCGDSGLKEAKLSPDFR